MASWKMGRLGSRRGENGEVVSVNGYVVRERSNCGRMRWGGKGVTGGRGLDSACSERDSAAKEANGECSQWYEGCDVALEPSKWLSV
eukprot:7896231-Prorocentrum_lima.AAC.1